MAHLFHRPGRHIAGIQIFQQNVALDDGLVGQQLAVGQAGDGFSADECFRRRFSASQIQYLTDGKGLLGTGRGHGIGHRLIAGVQAASRGVTDDLPDALRRDFQLDRERAVDVQPAGAGGPAVDIICFGRGPHTGIQPHAFDGKCTGEGLAEFAAAHTLTRFIQIHDPDVCLPVHQHPIPAELL